MSSDMLKVVLYVFKYSDKCLLRHTPTTQVGGMRDVGRNSVLRVANFPTHRVFVWDSRQICQYPPQY